MSATPHIVVIGAGPTGLGAAARLTELRYEHWQLVEGGTEDAVGGLARSIRDAHGFTWDIGGHVVFSHYAYVDDLLDAAVAEWNVHVRHAWVQMAGVWVPYPLQNNLHRLPGALREACEQGLRRAQAAREWAEAKGDVMSRVAPHFAAYMTQHFGDAVTTHFMRPYNRKVWATEAEAMSATWLRDRVAPARRADQGASTSNSDATAQRNTSEATAQDETTWGPNASFRFPRHGGTGAIYRGIWSMLAAGHCEAGPAAAVTGIDLHARAVQLHDGRLLNYDVLISTMPLDVLLKMIATYLDGATDAAITDMIEPDARRVLSPHRLRTLAHTLRYTSTHVIGLGIRGAPEAQMREACWVYFPESDVPFYRATVLSNYAASNAPPGHWSLMLEVSEEGRVTKRGQDTTRLIEDCIDACRRHGLLRQGADVVVSRWHTWVDRGYPVPTIGRDAVLQEVLPVLRDCLGIYSRGRFGAWKYEVANQDHSIMQGVEAVDHVFAGRVAAGPRRDAGVAVASAELERTLHCPDEVNGTRDTRRCTLRPLPHAISRDVRAK